MDDYSDDGLDGLNSDVLQELENNAIQFTQARSQAPPQTQYHNQAKPAHDVEFEDDDLDDTVVINGLMGAPAAPAPTAAVAAASRSYPRPPLPPGPRNSTPNHPQQHAIPPSQRPNPSQGYPIRPVNSQFARPPLPPPPRHSLGPSQRPQVQHDAGNDMVAALQRRVRALEAELNSAKGEAAIIRSNSTKAQQDFSGEIARLRKLNAEQEAKAQRVTEAAIAKEKSATTELEFLQRDMKEVNARAKRRDGASTHKPAAAAAGTTTPKKSTKTWAMADGFDDLDMVPSPLKSRGKSRDGGGMAAMGERTPTRNKRKRPMVDSPVQALETNEEDVVMGSAPEAIAPVPPSLALSALPIEFLPLILDHGVSYGEPPTFDILSRYSFPSDPATSFAAYIYQKLPLLGNPHNPLQLLVDFSRLVLAMWEKCLGEEYFRPIWDLASLLAFTLQLDTKSVAPHIINELLPVAEQSIYKIADLRYQSASGDLSSDPAADALQQQIDTTYILSIAHLVAMACVTSVAQTEEHGVQTRQADFWRMVPMDLVLMLLTPKQRLEDILLMLDLLCTSALTGSLGPLLADRAPDLGARMVIEKVSANLVDYPKAASTPRQRHAIALAVLRALGAFVRTPFGATQLASHIQAIPRLVTTLSALIDELYDMAEPVPLPAEGGGTGSGPERRPPPPGDGDDYEDWRGLHQLIKQIVSLLHRLVTGADTSKAADIQAKLAGAYGGPQRYILSLSRIHFAEEDLLYESGIDEATADMARELCEYVVTPDEGEGVREAFGV
ncbi:hypothetical protein F5X68DRAFT_271598 [Plectosphaerella plurivora]|uniref:DNA repair protein Rad26 n=1 Tax=Plectosphaerella plurivora TaxID=936078 RepID=A0A9P8V1Q3_9PEZI|nr:hypothetical protein F5X68DRAFT_271598 [Plectosphaerella plurivora]